ncbi:DNA-directed DNA polymerase IV [Ascoidea rubescens DSM 1968]|uniref:DNA polymerase n=1 Tax=Ascoidea rubescens DSM 1968 TaxID=1344418 RepID=A0A1D2VPH7_9ASCO|nr:Nucleotidyltransferase [Ascoidea rubescens DSM 1968]ODV63455.1 Nucleotidyltransferase [Ascoidea rubescens DSM 1968]
MPPLNIFENLTFLQVPLEQNGLSIFRKRLFVRNGARVKRSWTPKNRETFTHILVNLSRVRDNNDILRRLKIQDGSELGRIIVVDEMWACDSIEQEKLLDTGPYVIHFLPRLEPSENTESEAEKTSEKLNDYKENTKKDNDIINKESKFVAESYKNSLADFVHPNMKIINELTKFIDIYEVLGEGFRSLAYKKAIRTLYSTNKPITTKNDCVSLPGIGNGISSKIEEYFTTNKIEKLESFKNDPKLQVLTIFRNVYGVGPAIAKNWYDLGYRTLDDIKNNVQLTTAQQYGIKYYDDWSKKIPREECTKHLEFLTKIVEEIDPKAKVYSMGSYRRGKSFCSDIDYIITREETDSVDYLVENLLQKLIDKLFEMNYLNCSLSGLGPTITIKDDIADTSQKKRKVIHGTNFHGGCRLIEYGDKAICRRIDFLLTPWNHIGAALMHFTGNDTFNRSIRLRAENRNMKLSQNGLMRKNEDGTFSLIEAFDERKIFEILEMPYLTPQERNL